MAKKSRRVRRRGTPRLSPAQMVQPSTEVAGEDASPAVQAFVAQQEKSLEEEYHYVIADLGRIGVLALVMLAALITMAFLVT